MDYDTLIGRQAYALDDKEVGTIDDLYVDDESGIPKWATVRSGLFGAKRHFVPLSLAQETDEGIVLHTTSDKIADAPAIEVDEELTEDEQLTLFEHYRDSYRSNGSGGGDMTDQGEEVKDTEGQDVSGPNTDTAMTRSEEELSVGTQQREVGRARLKKYIVTEHVQTTVPVQREEVRVEREPITNDNVDRAMDGPELSEEEHEVVLNEEVPVVDKKVVPKERVRLTKDTKTDEREVNEEVRKEQIDLDDRAA